MAAVGRFCRWLASRHGARRQNLGMESGRAELVTEY